MTAAASIPDGLEPTFIPLIRIVSAIELFHDFVEMANSLVHRFINAFAYLVSAVLQPVPESRKRLGRALTRQFSFTRPSR